MDAATPTIQDLEDLDLRRNHSVQKILVSPPAPPPQYIPLVDGTEPFAYPWLASSHRNHHGWKSSDLACFVVENATVAGDGNIWLSDRLLIDRRIMPKYVQNYIGVFINGKSILENYHNKSVREISDPCLVAAGHGTGIYGHFLIELLFRVLVANYTPPGSLGRHKILLDSRSPRWLIDILTNHLSIDCNMIEYFDPLQEKILLKQAILPGRALKDYFFHSFTIDMIEDLKRSVPPTTADIHDCIFVTRGSFSNPPAPIRMLMNEDSVADIARSEFGFATLAPERLSWHDQIRLFENTRAVIGQAGSALHNSIFSASRTIVASIGFQNLVQSQIGALCGHRNAFFTQQTLPAGEYTIDEDDFRRFMSAIAADLARPSP